MPKPSLCLVLGLVLAACGPELTPRTTVDSLRILAIQADPPEVQPGQAAFIRILVVDPLGEGRALDWNLTLCTPDASGTGCLEYSALLADYPNTDVANSEYAKCCVRGGTAVPANGTLEFGGISTKLTTSSHMLDGQDPIPARQGVNAQLNLLACETGGCVSGEGDGESSSPEDVGITLPQDQSALAIKRIRVSSTAVDEQNANPSIRGFLIDGEFVGGYQRPVLVAGSEYSLEPSIYDDAVECYTAVYSDGTEARVLESPYFSWYTTAGEFGDYFTEPAYTTDCGTTEPLEERMADAANVFRVPPIEALLVPELTLYLVMWDRRGGLAWELVTADVVAPD